MMLRTALIVLVLTIVSLGAASHAEASVQNGYALSQTLDPRQLPDVLKTLKPGGAKAVWLAYGYDSRRKISSVADLDGAGANEGRTYAYDANGRLLTASGPWGQNGAQATGSFKYDALGNLREQKLGTRTIAISYDAAKNRVSSANNGGVNRAYGYDARGNATGVAGNSFTYDFANQPTAVSGSATATYVYDGNLKRVKEVRGGKTIYTIFSKVTGGLIYRDEATDGVKTDYVTAGGAALRLKKTGTGAFVPEYTHFDSQGSAIAATNAAGTITWRERYAPFGEELLNPAGNANNTGYTGHLKDDSTGLNYMQARYYDPIIGRFLSTDPIGYQDQLNLYAYVGNDPVNKVDPTGEFAESFIDVALIAADIASIANDGFTAENTASLAGNLVGLALPGATGVGVATRGAVTAVKAADKAKNTAKAGAAAERAKNVAKGIPESKLGPSGKPKVHSVQHSTRKEAQQAAKREADKAGGQVRNDAHPQDGQKPHFQAEDAKGENVKPVVHHCKPDKAC